MDDSTIEALREVLQDMTLAIELISSGERSGEALINFIEEMLKAIETWAAKYNVILDADVMAMDSAQSFRPKPSLNSDLSRYANYPATNASEVKDHLEGSLILDQQLDVVYQMKEHDQTEREAHHQSVKSLNQDGEGNEEIGKHLMHFQNDENKRDERQVADKSKVKPLRRVSRKTRSQVALTSTDGGPMHVDGQAKANPLEPLTESPKLTDATSPAQASERKWDVFNSPDWLPKGWIMEMKTRGTSGSAGSKDKYYFDPTSKRRFQSKKEVLAFLGTTKRKRGRPKKPESLAELVQMTDESPRHNNDAAEAESIQESVMGFNSELQVLSNTSFFNNRTPANSSIIGTSTEAANSIMPTVDTTKRKRGRPRKIDSMKNLSLKKDQSPGHASAAAQASTISESVKGSPSQLQVPSNRSSDTTDMPPPVVASATADSSGPVNSCIPTMPHQLGQTSEWLVYESLASLPFPMFEHLRLVESNANKLANNNSAPTLWPWMLGNAEGLKKPLVDTKPDESKPVDESKQNQNASISSTGETQAAEIVPKRPKKAARKNAS